MMPSREHFGLGTREHERTKRQEFQRRLSERAEARKGDPIPIWCPEFPETDGTDFNEDEWGAL